MSNLSAVESGRSVPTPKTRQEAIALSRQMERRRRAGKEERAIREAVEAAVAFMREYGKGRRPRTSFYGKG